MSSGAKRDEGAAVDESWCPICYTDEDVPDVSLRPCGHFFCERCAERLAGYQWTCPLCRVPYAATRPPLVEYDVRGMRRLLLRLGRRRAFGFSIRDDDEGGVCVSAVSANSVAALAGIRVGMRLLSVNGLPCRSALVTRHFLRTSRRDKVTRVYVQRRATVAPWRRLARYVGRCFGAA